MENPVYVAEVKSSDLSFLYGNFTYLCVQSLTKLSYSLNTL